MRIETFGPRRLRLTLASIPLELWLYLDPGQPPVAVRFRTRSGRIAALRDLFATPVAALRRNMPGAPGRLPQARAIQREHPPHLVVAQSVNWRLPIRHPMPEASDTHEQKQLKAHA
jgi:hypothetical protein